MRSKREALVAQDAPYRLREPRRAEAPERQWRRPQTEFFDAEAVVILISQVGNDDLRNTGQRRRRGGTGPAMVNHELDPRKQLVVWNLTNHMAGIGGDSGDSRPTGGNHGALSRVVGSFCKKVDDALRVSLHHAPEAEVERGGAGLQELCQLGG